MKLGFRNPSVAGDFTASDKLAGFLVWLAANRTDERAISLLTLLAEHDRETDAEERQNIRRTLNEILTNAETNETPREFTKRQKNENIS